MSPDLYSQEFDFRDDYEASWFPDHTQSTWDHRFLAKKDDPRVDYSVLSVGVMTLGLIIVVEVVRHRIDHSVEGRPFVKAVLEGVYSELATLGIVEFFLYVLTTYYKDLDKKKYYVFADVHFALFYTAILNAFQSVLLAVVSSRVSRRIWVETEMLELNHYVEIREEFEKVKRELDAVTGDGDTKKAETNESFTSKRNQWASFRDISWPSTYETSEGGLKNLWKSLVHRIRNPGLRNKYNKLLLQIRFHELRVHFLQAYRLPLKLKVSDYLMRSEQQVHLKLVHVSPVAWLLLTGAVNILYYVVGIASYEMSDTGVVSTAFIWIFFTCMALFIMVAILVYYKMKAVFREIMVEKTLWDVNNVKDEEKEHLAEHQLALFWGGDPKLVIAAIQFMQFGYALLLSLVIIFWGEIDDGSIVMWVFLLSIAICYSLFVQVTAQVIPRYTLCTSLGQLVDQKRLYETLAEFTLSETQRAQAERAHMDGIDEYLLGPEESVPTTTSRSLGQNFVSRRGLPSTASSSTVESSLSPEGQIVDAATLMAELVKLDTDSLRPSLPEEERTELSRRQMDRANGRSRRKVKSEGVSILSDRSFVVRGDSVMGLNQAKDDTYLPSKYPRARDLAAIATEELKPEDTQTDKLRARRRNHRMQKSVSDGVALMARTDEDTFPVLEVHMEQDEHSSSNMGTQWGQRAAPKRPVPAVTTSSENSHIVDIKKSVESDDVRSTVSDEHSDADDVPDIDMTVPRNASEHHKPVRSLTERARRFILSKDFVVVSNVFGTLVAFFLIGQRIERFLHTEGIANEKFVSFDFKNEHTFWSLLAMLVLFCCVDLVIMFLLRPWKGTRQSFRERRSFVAAVLDFLLVGTCLTLFIVAEVDRCCHPEDRELAEKGGTDKDAYGYNSYSDYDDTYADYRADPAPCGCPRFGSRLYGGLGGIEPYISLVALRIFRHFIAKHLVVFFYKEDMTKSLRGVDFNPFAVAEHGSHDHGHGHGHGHEAKGTAAELWKEAVSKHPEIAFKYGEFSSDFESDA